MKKEQPEEAFELSYESDGKMGKKEKSTAPDTKEKEFFNSTQSSE